MSQNLCINGVTSETRNILMTTVLHYAHLGWRIYYFVQKPFDELPDDHKEFTGFREVLNNITFYYCDDHRALLKTIKGLHRLAPIRRLNVIESLDSFLPEFCDYAEFARACCQIVVASQVLAKALSVHKRKSCHSLISFQGDCHDNGRRLKKILYDMLYVTDNFYECCNAGDVIKFFGS